MARMDPEQLNDGILYHHYHRTTHCAMTNAFKQVSFISNSCNSSEAAGAQGWKSVFKFVNGESGNDIARLTISKSHYKYTYIHIKREKQRKQICIWEKCQRRHDKDEKGSREGRNRNIAWRLLRTELQHISRIGYLSHSLGHDSSGIALVPSCPNRSNELVRTVLFWLLYRNLAYKVVRGYRGMVIGSEPTTYCLMNELYG